MNRRREFLRGLGRSAALVFFGALTGRSLLGRSDREPSQTCGSPLTNCRDCGARDRCGVPRALSVKRKMKRTSREP